MPSSAGPSVREPSRVAPAEGLSGISHLSTAAMLACVRPCCVGEGTSTNKGVWAFARAV